jgi:hypothetical protein
MTSTSLGSFGVLMVCFEAEEVFKSRFLRDIIYQWTQKSSGIPAILRKAQKFAARFEKILIKFFTLFLCRYFKVSAISTVCLLLLSWIVTIYISLDHGYTHKVADPFESFDFLYDKPWQRFGPYVMGIFSFLFIFSSF